MAAPLWPPSAEAVARAQVTGFGERQGIADYPALHRWSIDQPEALNGALRNILSAL